MTHRWRFRTILHGGVPDRVAWVPRLDVWFHAHRNRGKLPKELDGMTLRQAEKYLGMAHSARDAVVFRRLYDGGERFFRGRQQRRTPVTDSNYWNDRHARLVAVRQE